ncbi:carbohydrate kinase : ADP-dependent (S)-NAD(P)H-hydrate dehydratase OS=planctomycete KSU-1 GN=nnrD PE=3 SV=1: Carb_kinase [Gemmataceae bacterium]|nr:carbohydrate kinase : ADP-dependent (S)-NAD(P)H-hydrate dehydratase OS=planctomycete KSU-1 GN=nnrD PE=3 SV=1: Carb_kinase [Gemmataceae bacterium]VTU01557.1 carbohydrate kinase : ADP-dependent (S)-NAD(P)H-hydrate dehydratase OS=planctomycete KSU-1 GN=nnrD PE=3 SV=1: Carb_kinase [Gemmataceae bacterium]
MQIVPVCEVPRLPRREFDGHKGSYGTVQVIAGSCGMAGAAVLVGSAALRAGAGLVRVACPAAVQNVVAVGNPCYTTAGIRQHADGTFSEGSAQEVVEFGKRADAVAIGPGLGQRAGVAEFVRAVVTGLPQVPVVIDADGLNAIAPFDGEFKHRSEPLILTPHPGEFARLTGFEIDEVVERRVPLAVEFAARTGVVLLLKGSNTIVTDGKQLYRNSTGNPGMASGGCGDALTGVIAALVAQGLGEFDAAALGAWVHGRAGDLAAAALGQTALTATDVVAHLPAAFRELEANW